MLTKIKFYQNKKPVTKQKAGVMTFRGSPKQSIFDNVHGCHEMRFVKFNDLPEQNSKYHTQVGIDF